MTLDNLRLRHAADLVHFIQSLPTLEECWCKHIQFLDGSSIPARGHHLTPALSDLTLSQCGDGDFASQLQLASGILDAQKRSQLHEENWSATFNMIQAIMPPAYRVCTVEFSEEGPFSISCSDVF